MSKSLVWAVTLLLLAFLVAEHGERYQGGHNNNSPCQSSWKHWQNVTNAGMPLDVVVRAERDFYDCVDPDLLKQYGDLLSQTDGKVNHE